MRPFNNTTLFKGRDGRGFLTNRVGKAREKKARLVYICSFRKNGKKFAARLVYVGKCKDLGMFQQEIVLDDLRLEK